VIGWEKSRKARSHERSLEAIDQAISKLFDIAIAAVASPV
jgi:hypothetical protein